MRLEFVLGAIGCLTLGIAALVSARSGVWLAVGGLAGRGVNYIPLALYAQSFSAPGRLETEIGDADVRAVLSAP